VSRFLRAKVGDRYVLEMLHQRGWLYRRRKLRAHLCLDCHTTGDGIISALQVLCAMRRSGKTLAELTARLRLFPQKLINVRIAKGFDWENHGALKLARAEVETQPRQSDGRILIRPSGTEPLLRVMVEARDDDLADRAARRLVDAIAACSVVAVAQLVESRIVILVVVGSSPISHPTAAVLRRLRASFVPGGSAPPNPRYTQASQPHTGEQQHGGDRNGRGGGHGRPGSPVRLDTRGRSRPRCGTGLARTATPAQQRLEPPRVRARTRDPSAVR
jgi:hypothetical protein